MSVWSGYEPLAAVRERAGDRLVTAVNAALTESAASLTEAIAGAPDAYEQHVARRAETGRPVWHAIADPHSTGATRLFIAEIHGLIGSVLGALRSRDIDDAEERLRAYEAIDLASWRAAHAAQLLTTTDPYPADRAGDATSAGSRP